ncbi:hypothetical protein [Eubacterium barkeri]|uniref:Lipoprotein n=1 Tax=Eubacterium barkeri TaxID=1528 RepID=A0A1H3IR77_EUBBA|nr:hypothetical protein [Eubacterium barkeri]SDY29815.1 hypothetical protein SAMN04488579_12438 [Eubacterium barkeri]
MTDKSWRHIAQATAAISGCAAVAFAVWMTGSAWCLWGLVLVGWMLEVI